MYPLKFTPVFQERIWGGNRLAKVLGKTLPGDLAGKPVGESWELADLPLGTVKKDSRGAAADGSLSSVISNGPARGQTLNALLTARGREMMGKVALHGGRFPLLIKFLDAQTDLSVQVHPDGAYCARHPEAHLKSEAWYIMHAEPGAKVYKGLKPGVTKDDLRAALASGQVEPLLNAFKVRAGDCHYLESGTVHALGAGILAAEVQTPSDTTFRVFDWNRLGPDGKPRALHVEEALETIRFGGVEPAVAADALRSQATDSASTVSRLVTCDYFTLDRVRAAQGATYEVTSDEPTVWMVLEGQGVIQCPGAGPTAFAKGETLLLPAGLKQAAVKMVTDASWLEARIPSAG